MSGQLRRLPGALLVQGLGLCVRNHGTRGQCVLRRLQSKQWIAARAMHVRLCGRAFSASAHIHWADTARTAGRDSFFPKRAPTAT